MTKNEKQSVLNLARYRPQEIVKDEFAYDRIVSFYQDFLKRLAKGGFVNYVAKPRRGSR